MKTDKKDTMWELLYVEGCLNENRPKGHHMGVEGLIYVVGFLNENRQKGYPFGVGICCSISCSLWAKNIFSAF